MEFLAGFTKAGNEPFPRNQVKFATKAESDETDPDDDKDEDGESLDKSTGALRIKAIRSVPALMETFSKRSRGGSSLAPAPNLAMVKAASVDDGEPDTIAKATLRARHAAAATGADIPAWALSGATNSSIGGGNVYQNVAPPLPGQMITVKRTSI